MNPRTFDEYWLGYLAGHSRPSTRFVHYLGLFFAPIAGAMASVLVVWWAFLVIVPLFYLAALLTHPLLEHNSNKPFAERPLWSAIALLRMLALDLTGGLGRELKRLDEVARRG
ncbi:Mpo1-like protein [Mesorhizobium sp. ES1-1]|uniref:Mpo1-like protein n=1 Tax=Mesorhizobium sp. ES1-1 TaxID=2876629 RepID=UPI001CCA10F5|nr:Mpo1-like protein [Mesorhizobium sp. ES1-1]MBZ9677129.1 DUF962 domain-containing protein [Mesorhizobium sp. ES1-1]